MTVGPLSPPRAAPDVPGAPAPSFWRRLFAGVTAFDVAFGVVLPLLLAPAMGVVGAFKFQPFHEVLRSVVVMPFALLQVVLLASWFVARWRIGAANAAFAGALVAGAALAVTCGIDLLPLSVTTALVGIGFLGLIPFATAFVFVRSGRAAWTIARADAGRAACLALAAASFVMAAGLPIAAARWVDREIEEAMRAIADADPAVAAAATSRLVRIAWYPGFTADSLLARYDREHDDAVKVRIATAYRAVTGRHPQDVIAEHEAD